MTKSEIRDCGIVWNTSSSINRGSICLDDFLKHYERIPKDITIESKPNSCDIITETLRSPHDMYDFLKRMMDLTCGKIKIIKVEMETYSLNTFPEIYVEYTMPINTTVCGTLSMPKNIGMDVCCIDDNIMYKRDYKEPKKEEPKEENILQFKEISW